MNALTLMLGFIMIVTMWFLICLAEDVYKQPIAAAFDTEQECVAELNKSTAKNYWACEGFSFIEDSTKTLKLDPNHWS